MSATPRRTRSINKDDRLKRMRNLIRDIFDLENESTLETAIVGFGIHNIQDLTTLLLEDIDLMDVPRDLQDRNKGSDPLLPGHAAPLKNFIIWMEYRRSKGEPTDASGIEPLTRSDYIAFIGSRDFTAWRTRRAIPSPVKPTQRTEAEEFRRGIKRDPTLFKEFKTDDVFEPWQRQLLTQARAQGVEQVLDHAYITEP